MEVLPIQTDGNRCEFDHYYISDSRIKDIWKEIDSIYCRGDDIIKARTSPCFFLFLRYIIFPFLYKSPY